MELIELLRNRPYNINQMAEKLGLNYRTVKHHVDILLKYQLINSSKTGGYGDVFFLSPDLEGNMPTYDSIVKKIDTVKKLTDFTDTPQFFRTVLQQTYECVIIVDADWEVFFWNESASRVFGYTSGEILHVPLNIFFDESIFNELKKKVEKDGRLDDLETFGMNKSGERIDISITLDQIKQDDNTTIGYSALIRDISDRKRAEEALKRAEMEISRQKGLAILGRMAGSVGQELYNPLASIKNAAYFLGMVLEGADLDVKETVEILKCETVESERIIKTLLDFAHTKPTKRTIIDVNVPVRNAISRIAVPGSIKVSNRLARKLPKVFADQDQLEVVFGNVILNAVQAMPEGGDLTIGSRAIKPDSVSVTIADTGDGVPEEHMGLLFDPLFTTKPKGIGLGLAIAQKLVEANGGKIEARNGDKAGFTVTITIPVDAGEVVK